MCVVNLAADDPLLLAVGKPSFHTIFMQKRLGNEGEGTSPPPPRHLTRRLSMTRETCRDAVEGKVVEL